MTGEVAPAEVWSRQARTTARVSGATAARGLVLVCASLSAAYWWAVALARWDHLELGAFDFAFFDQIIWNTSQGRLLTTTFTPYHFTGQHVEPVLLLFGAAYRLGAGPLFLLGTQAIVCALASVALFEAARALRLPAAVGAAAAIAYLLNPYLQRALQFDFHPETMVALPAFTALWAFAKGNPGLGVACGVSVLLFKEDAVFVALALAASAAMLGARRHSALLAAVALGWALLTVGALMPLVRWGQPSDLLERYDTILGGGEGRGVLGRMLGVSAAIARTLLAQDRVATAATFVAASGPWLLAAPLLALTLLPGLVLALLSAHPQQQTLELHYAAELVPVSAIAGLFGTRQLARIVPTRLLAPLMCAIGVAGWFALAPPWSLGGGPGTPTEAHRAAVAQAVSMVPPEASVSAQSNIAPRLAHRRQLWEFPGELARAEWVVVDQYGFRSRQSIDAGFDAAVEAVRARHALVFEADGVAVYRAQRP